ncbi:MAG: hypothetical protein NW215_12360 [Hyphomicrobiales bacterium]|nr:hypothetical protein [Hyphomicrobiales bacterium]
MTRAAPFLAAVAAAGLIGAGLWLWAARGQAMLIDLQGGFVFCL